jgi:two-component system chemotaxis sensor kinase CheA
MKDSARYAELFLTESRDNLVAVNEALLRLERDARDSAAIDAAFRAVHTIKGMAGVMGYGAVADLAHDMEALLAGARDEQRGLRSDDPPLLFEAADALEAAIEASVAGRSGDVDVNAICARLRGWATGMHAEPSTVGEFLLPAGEGIGVTVTMSRDTPLRGARAMIVLQRARSLGHVVAVVPEERALAEEAFEHTFAFRLKTNASQELITSTVTDAGYVESVRVTREGRTADPAGAAVDRADAAWSAGTHKTPLQRYVRIDLRRLDALMNLMG